MKVNKALMSANLPSDEEIQKWSDNNYWNQMSPSEAMIAANNLKDKCANYHANIDVDAELNSSFKGLVYKQEDGKNYITGLDFESKDLGIAGYGFGIDLGASYKIFDNLIISASILDLGFINWSKASTKIAHANSEKIDIKGSKYSDMININNPQSVSNAVNQLQSDANDYMDRVSDNDILGNDLFQMTIKDADESRKSRLASTVVLGAEYGFFNNKLAFGILSTTRFVQPDAITEVTLSANYRPKSWFNTSISYSAIQSFGKSFGVGLKLGPIFVGTDYMFLGKNSKSVNGFIGVSVQLGGHKI